MLEAIKLAGVSYEDAVKSDKFKQLKKKISTIVYSSVGYFLLMMILYQFLKGRFENTPVRAIDAFAELFDLATLGSMRSLQLRVGRVIIQG